MAKQVKVELPEQKIRILMPGQRSVDVTLDVAFRMANDLLDAIHQIAGEDGRFVLCSECASVLRATDEGL